MLIVIIAIQLIVIVANIGAPKDPYDIAVHPQLLEYSIHVIIHYTVYSIQYTYKLLRIQYTEYNIIIIHIHQLFRIQYTSF